MLNKADALDEDRRRELAFRHPDGVLISAVSGEGIEHLLETIVAEFDKRLVDLDLLVPYREGATLNELHRLAGDLDREDRPEGVHVAVRLPRPVAARFERYATTNGHHA